MATNKLQWKRIAKGDRLPCDSLLMKKDGTIPSIVSGAGVKVGQDAYYLSVEELKSFPKEESENEKTKRLLHTIAYKIGQHLRDIFTEEEYQCYDAWSNAWLEKQSEPTEINPSEFDSQLNSLLKKFESLPKEELAGILNFYLNVVRNDGTYKEEKQGEQKHQYNSRPRYIGEEELLGERNHTDKVEPKFKVGDIIRLKGSAAEYTIKKVTDTTYYTNGWSCGIERCEDDYELVEQKPVKVPKFKVGDFIQFNGMGHTRYTIKEVCGLSHYINTCNKRMDMSYTDANFELVEQKPNGWSEEDERIKNNLLSELTNLSVRKLIKKETEKKYASWLKSLRPQSYWRPSDKQMETLAYYMHALVCNEHKEILFGLYADLKKLKA